MGEPHRHTVHAVYPIDTAHAVRQARRAARHDGQDGPIRFPSKPPASALARLVERDCHRLANRLSSGSGMAGWTVPSCSYSCINIRMFAPTVFPLLPPSVACCRPSQGTAPNPQGCQAPADGRQCSADLAGSSGIVPIRRISRPPVSPGSDSRASFASRKIFQDERDDQQRRRPAAAAPIANRCTNANRGTSASRRRPGIARQGPGPKRRSRLPGSKFDHPPFVSPSLAIPCFTSIG